MKKENDFQSKLIKRLRTEFPGSIVLKNDSGYIQGIPDLTVFHKDRWVVLECKRSKDAPHQPNQDYYISMLNDMSYASFIYPENEEEVMDEIRQVFRPER